jgi:hypothetical protein
MNKFLSVLHAAVLAAGLLPAGAYQCQGQAAATPPYPTPGMADCVKVLRADSVHMFFDEGYALVPTACAGVRRECRLDAAGNFAGEVRDYALPANTLLYRLQYQEGQRNGRYEQYHPNQQLAIRGQFDHGRPSGTWQFWYPTGQPLQTLEWTGQDQPRLRIIAYWDVSGQQQVSAGAGTWMGTTTSFLQAQYGGRVVDGFPQGTWKSYRLQNHDLLTVEEFRKGRLVAGIQYVGGEQRLNTPLKYKTKPSLEPQITDASLAAEPFHFGKSCEEQAAIAAANALLQAAVVEPPKPPRETSAYQREVLHRLAKFTTATKWMPRTDGKEEVITAEVDENGRLHNFESETGILASAFTSFIPLMGTWHPATANGHPVPGKMRFTLHMYSSELQSNMQTAVTYPLPLEVLKKPTP